MAEDTQAEEMVGAQKGAQDGASRAAEVVVTAAGAGPEAERDFDDDEEVDESLLEEAHREREEEWRQEINAERERFEEECGDEAEGDEDHGERDEEEWDEDEEERDVLKGEGQPRPEVMPRVGFCPPDVDLHALFDAVEAYASWGIDALTLVREVRTIVGVTVLDLQVDDARYASTRKDLVRVAEECIERLVRTREVGLSLDRARTLRDRTAKELPSAAMVPTAEEEAEFARMVRQDEIEEGIAVDVASDLGSAASYLVTTVRNLLRADDVRAFNSARNAVICLLVAQEAAQGAEPASAQPTAASWSRKVH